MFIFRRGERPFALSKQNVGADSKTRPKRKDNNICHRKLRKQTNNTEKGFYKDIQDLLDKEACHHEDFFEATTGEVIYLILKMHNAGRGSFCAVA